WFDAERSAPTSHTLTLAPRGKAPDGPWLDGHAVRSGVSSVGPGLHLVQYLVGTRTLSNWIVLAGDALVVHPDAYPERALTLVTDPERRDDLGPLLRVSFPAGTVWLVSGGTVVEATIAADAVTMEVRASPPAPVADDKKKRH